jgi:hypothetical protein
MSCNPRPGSPGEPIIRAVRDPNRVDHARRSHRSPRRAKRVVFRLGGKRARKKRHAASWSKWSVIEIEARLATMRQVASAPGQGDQTKTIEIEKGIMSARSPTRANGIMPQTPPNEGDFCQSRK